MTGSSCQSPQAASYQLQLLDSLLRCRRLGGLLTSRPAQMMGSGSGHIGAVALNTVALKHLQCPDWPWDVMSGKYK